MIHIHTKRSSKTKNVRSSPSIVGERPYDRVVLCESAGVQVEGIAETEALFFEGLLVSEPRSKTRGTLCPGAFVLSLFRVRKMVPLMSPKGVVVFEDWFGPVGNTQTHSMIADQDDLEFGKVSSIVAMCEIDYVEMFFGVPRHCKLR